MKNEDRPGTQQGTQSSTAPLAAASLEYDLSEEIEKLRRQDAWRVGRNAITLAKYGDLRVVLTVLKAKSRINQHKAEGRISVQTVEGHIRMHALGREFDMPQGHFLTLDRGVPHDVEALEDSAFLLTIAWPNGDR